MSDFQQIRAKKRLGQHFLNDPNIAKKIVSKLDNKYNHKAIIEVGPGSGALTRYLIDYKKEPLYLIEIDTELASCLKKAYPSLRDRLIIADFLKFNLSNVCLGSIGIIGNFPYNISSQIFFKILSSRNQVNEVVCMIQKEVADRIAAKPSNKTYGILSVLLQAFYNISYCFVVSPSAFCPKPKVYSAVIKLERNSLENLDCDEKLFFKVVKAGFGQRRKMLGNSLGVLNISLEDIPKAVLRKRAEELSVDDFVLITKELSNSLALKSA